MKLQNITPNFGVQDIRKTVSFYQDVLGFELEMAVPEDKGSIEGKFDENKNYVYAMMSRDEVGLMFQRTDSLGEDVPALKDVKQGASVSFYIEVQDIDSLYQDIKSKADVIIDLQTTWYGLKEFYIRDCNGYILVFAEEQLES